MAERITQKVLERRLARLNDRLKASPEDDRFMSLDICSWGGCNYKVVANQGSANVSPRLTARACYEFINGMITVLDYAEK